jgi:hypothetical protein
MDSAYANYYKEQCGSGLTAYHGLQYQYGHGFFGSLFTNIIKPLGKYLGKQALNTGVKIGSDYLSGQDIKDSLKRNLKTTANQMLDDGYQRAKKYAQTGSGKRRRRRRKNKLAIKPKRRIKKRPKRANKSFKGKRAKRKLIKKKSRRRRSKKHSKISELF